MQQNLFDHVVRRSEKADRDLKTKRSLGLEIDGEKGLGVARFGGTDRGGNPGERWTPRSAPATEF
jgi:hypothetical protein